MKTYFILAVYVSGLTSFVWQEFVTNDHHTAIVPTAYLILILAGWIWPSKATKK